MSPQSTSFNPADFSVVGLAGRTCWIVSDGKAGHEAQSLGVAKALDLDTSIKRVNPKGIHRTLSPYLPVSRQEKFGTSDSSFYPPWPDIAIGAGRLAVPYMRAIKRHAGSATFTVILLDPKFGYATADLVWVPQHDQKSGANVFSTLTPPHRYSPSELALLRQESPPYKVPDTKLKAVVLLGGPNGRARYDGGVIERLVASLRSLVVHNSVTLLATASRRTPRELSDAVKTVVDESNGYFWDGSGENPIGYFYAHGDLFIAPADSINMVAEPCVTGRPVYVFHPEGSSSKFDRFHGALAAYGATKRLPDFFSSHESWSYPPLFAADAIANEIIARWSARNLSHP